MTERDSVGQTCTCGIGPWAVNGECEACGGIDPGIPTLPPRTFRPNEPVTLTGVIIGSSIVNREYVIHVNGDPTGGGIRVHADAITPAHTTDEQLTLTPDVRTRLRQTGDMLRDWQARLPRFIRDIDDALRR